MGPDKDLNPNPVIKYQTFVIFVLQSVGYYEARKVIIVTNTHIFLHMYLSTFCLSSAHIDRASVQSLGWGHHR